MKGRFVVGARGTEGKKVLRSFGYCFAEDLKLEITMRGVELVERELGN